MEEENGKYGGKINKMGYEEIEVPCDVNCFVENRKYTAKELRNFFVEGKEGWDWSWNITKQIWGYGSDIYDWNNNRGEYIDESEIEEIFLKNKKKAIIILKNEK